MIPMSYYLILSSILFSIALAGIFLNRKNIIIMLMSLELMFLSINYNFIIFGNYLNDLVGQVFVFYINCGCCGISNWSSNYSSTIQK